MMCPTGKITQPSKQLWENDIYRTAMFMHDEFNQTEELKETTLKWVLGFILYYSNIVMISIRVESV